MPLTQFLRQRIPWYVFLTFSSSVPDIFEPLWAWQGSRECEIWWHAQDPRDCRHPSQRTPPRTPLNWHIFTRYSWGSRLSKRHHWPTPMPYWMGLVQRRVSLFSLVWHWLTKIVQNEKQNSVRRGQYIWRVQPHRSFSGQLCLRRGCNAWGEIFVEYTSGKGEHPLFYSECS